MVDGTVWLTQREMADLFGVSIPNISMHLREIYNHGELTRDRTIQKYLTVRSEGDRTIRRNVDHYNLDVVLAVGYRVRGRRGVQFRTWASRVLSEYVVKGFAVDDYDKDDPRSQSMFRQIQNQLHYTVTGQTAADNLGLTSFAGKKVRKKDVSTAKNYLTHPELDELNRLVDQFLSYAESQARRRKVIHMADWLVKTDQFIEFNDYEALD